MEIDVYFETMEVESDCTISVWHSLNELERKALSGSRDISKRVAYCGGRLVGVFSL